MFKKLLLTTSLAVLCGQAAIAQPALYVGAGLGVVVNTSNRAFGSDPGYFRGVPLNIFAGYGGIIDQNFFLAGEITGVFGTAEITDKNGLKTTYSYGVSIVPGLGLSDHTFAFVRAGLVRSRFTNTGDLSTGGQVGVGIQSGLTQNIDLRMEYDYTTYRSVGGLTTPRQDMINLNLIYRFEY